MKTVLVLTASFGDGHNAAARNVCDALESLSSDVKVDVLDLFQSSYGRFNTMARNAYSGLVRFAPALWGGIYSLLDKPALADNSYFKLGKLQRALGTLLQDTQPDVVVSTYPLYATVIRDLYRDHAERPFKLVTVITDSITINSAWLQSPSDIYCVPNEATADVLRTRSVPATKIKTFGFPVSPLFCQLPESDPPDPGDDGPYRILYLVNTGKKKLGKCLKKVLERKENHLTIAVGRNAYLKASLTEKLKRYGDRVQVLGWTNQMPHLMRTHHLLIGKAGGAMVQEAIAARCPMIANQVIPGQEEGNAQLLADNDIGAVALKPRDVAEWVKNAFKRDAKLWRRWRENLARISRPDAALRIAQMILEECDSASADDAGSHRGRESHAPLRARDARELVGCASPSGTINGKLQAAPLVPSSDKSLHPLLCDFHIHTNYSDGKLSIAEVVDFYGRRRFDCICITDHLADSRRLIGKLGKLTRLTLSPNQLAEYFEVIERERRRAWRKYGMLLMTGLEFNKDGLTKKSSAHLLGVDLHMPIVDCLDLPETIAQIHAQGGLAVASHPHIMKSEWGKNTLYLWENQERFAPLLDAWEIANRNNMFNPVSAKRLPYLANSDFHKPKHIYSWKTLVSCEKNPEAIKECIRKNERIAITLYRETGATIETLTPALALEATQRLLQGRDLNVSPLLPAA
jgi:UDP-N-acetylglucosamine:LPS N-acetylglucosamine transferase/predicted metal-dependent phosphoesterase TrpH